MPAAAQDDLQRWTEEARDRAPQMRGLGFTRDVPVEFISRESIGAELLEMVDRQYPEAWRIRIDRSYKAFDLVPRDSDVLGDMLELVVSQAGGFYDPHGQRIVIPDDLEQFLGDMLGGMMGGADGVAGIMEPMMANILTHEFTHALQDQTHGLDELLGTSMDNDDLRLALAALIEGDATLIGTAAMTGDLEAVLEQDPAAMAALMGATGMVGPEAAAMPPILRESLIFPYSNGYRLIATMAQRGGMEAVDAAFADPPLSTEQVMHIEKYLGEQRDVPTAIELPDFGLGEFGWINLGTNTLGEFQIRVLLGGSPDAIRAAEGWDGDRFAVFEHQDGRLALAWLTVWDSNEDAQQFADEYRYADGRRFEADERRPRALEDAAGWATAQMGGEGDTTTISRKDDRVAIVRGLPAGLVDPVLNATRGLAKTRPMTWADMRATPADATQPAGTP
ncbi:MAG: hypothetical protein AAFX79_06455 [Planctomycetota bacterium]